MRMYIISDYDGNDEFVVAGKDELDCLREALYQLGWNYAIDKEEEDEEES